MHWKIHKKQLCSGTSGTHLPGHTPTSANFYCPLNCSSKGNKTAVQQELIWAFLLMSYLVTTTESPLHLFAFYMYFYFNHWPCRMHQNQEWNKLHKKPVLEGKAVHREWLAAVWSKLGVFWKGQNRKRQLLCQEWGWPGRAQSCPALEAQVSPGTHMAAPVTSQQWHPVPFALHFYSQKKPCFNIQSKTLLSYKWSSSAWFMCCTISLREWCKVSLALVCIAPVLWALFIFSNFCLGISVSWCLWKHLMFAWEFFTHREFLMDGTSGAAVHGLG